MRRGKGASPKVGKGGSVRPITNRALETLLAILADELVEARFLDLFAGTGRVGLGALECGAAKVVFVEADGRVARLLRAALKGRPKTEAELLVGVVPRVLDRLAEPFDLVWADPPYDWKPCGEFADALRRLTTPGGLFVVEHHHKVSYQEFEQDWHLERQVKHGETRLSFFRSRFENS